MKWYLPIALTVVAATAIVLAFVFQSQAPEEVRPERVAIGLTTKLQEVEQTHPKVPVTEPVRIRESDITGVKIPAVKIDVRASGETWPRRSSRCHATEYCIDPPLLKEVAWFGAYARPSLPSTNSVLIFGHSNRYSHEWQAFNNLSVVRKGDRIVVDTQTGRFVYVAHKPVLVPYDQVPTSRLIYNPVPNRTVLVTCESNQDSAVVVIADLVSAVTR